MAQVQVEVEEDPDCGRWPLQTFRALEPARTAGVLRVPGVYGSTGPGRSSDGAGMRLRPANDRSPWALGAAARPGEGVAAAGPPRPA